MLANPTIVLELQGHTDPRASDAYNQKLGERRSLSVRNYLIRKGISPARMTIRSFGERQRRSDGETRLDFARDRASKSSTKMREISKSLCKKKICNSNQAEEGSVVKKVVKKQGSPSSVVLRAIVRNQTQSAKQESIQELVKRLLPGSLTVLGIAAANLGAPVSAQTILFQETFRGSATTAPFIFGSGRDRQGGLPCLTAATVASALPSCQDGTSDTEGNGALRLTASLIDQRGFVIYDRAIRTQFGLSITFDFFAYNGTGADGTTFFLIDSNANPREAGSFGGSLGYAQRRSTDPDTPDEPGIEGGYLGIGFDEFGNFANDGEGRGGGFVEPGSPLPANCTPSPLGRPPIPEPINRAPDSVTLRGPGAGTTGYCFLANSGPLGAGIDNNTATSRALARRSARITLTPGANPTVRVEVDFGGGFQTVIAERPAPPGFPEAFKFGFAASTGSQTNLHEIQNLVVRSLTPVPPAQLGVAKQVGVPVNNNDGTFTIPYIITVQNPSDINVINLQVTDDLTQTFTNGATFTIVPNSVQSATLRVNPNFNGSSDTNLLAGTDTLAFGQTATVNFSVRLTPGNTARTFLNTAIGTGRDPENNLITDASTNGVTPDANGNNNPNDDSTPTPINLTSQFRLVKRITAVTRNGIETRFGQFIDDVNDINDTAPGFAQLSPVGLAAVDRANPLRAGDEAEYTIYYLSDGTQPVFLANICDPIPVGSTFVLNSLAVKVGSAQPTIGGSFFSPLSPLPTNNSCPDPTNTRGAALFDLGTVSSTPGENFGFVRFRVRIN